MKPFNRFPVMTILIATMALSSCKDDVYDPDKIRQIPPAENPFGEDFKAPDGFDWSMITTVKLNIEVKDEFSGQYHYLIEVFTTNPLNDATATPIAVGVAKQGDNYVAEITAPKTLEKLYIRQTDPRQRKEVYEFAKADNMNCKLYISNSNTRAANTLAATRAETTITDPQYTEPTVPQNATELKDEDYQYGANLPDGTYVISSTFSKSISGNATIYVKGQYNNPTNDWTSTITVNSKLIILSGGSVNCCCLNASTSASVQNFGTLTVQSATFQKASELYNAGTINCTGTLTMQGEDNNGSSLYNHGNLIASNELTTSTSCKVLNTKEGSLTVNGKFSMQSSQLDNYGKVYAMNSDKEYDSYSKSIQVNQTTSSIINNYKDALIETITINGGAAINNYGTMKMNECVSKNSDNILYNNCTFIVTEKLNYRYITLDNGAITGKQEDTQWQPVETFSVDNHAKVVLKNGSIILANIFKPGNPSEFTAEGDAVSMIKAKATHYQGNTDFKGLALELGDEYKVGWNGQRIPIDESNIIVNKTNCPSSATDESKYTIETCGGIINDGSEGDSPQTPEYPAEIGDTQGYTYAFEDQWPIYGDYDMNDVVLTIDRTKFTVEKKNGDEFVKEMKIEGRVKAVGASQTLGIGIQFLGLNNNVKTSELKQNSDLISFEDGNHHPTLIVCEDAHRYMDSRQTDNTFINTEIGGETDEAKNFNFSIKFDGQDVKPENLTIDKLDVFIYCKKNTHIPHRREIHLAGYAPTAYADQSFSGASNDNGKKEFTSNENLAWGIRIPSNEWSWPQEYIMIKDVYGDFKAWVTSGGTSGTDWWNNDNVNTSKLYHK